MIIEHDTANQNITVPPGPTSWVTTLRRGTLFDPTAVESTVIQSKLVNPVTCAHYSFDRIKEQTGLNS